MEFSKQAAQELAFEALLYLAERPELMRAFLANTGFQAEDMRKLAQDPEFGLHVLDFLVEDDARILDFAETANIRPEQVMTARTALAGPGSFGWETE